jgi:hypothetical protein
MIKKRVQTEHDEEDVFYPSPERRHFFFVEDSACVPLLICHSGVLEILWSGERESDTKTDIATMKTRSMVDVLSGTMSVVLYTTQ